MADQRAGTDDPGRGTLSDEEVELAIRRYGMALTEDDRAELQRGIFARAAGLAEEYPLPWISRIAFTYPIPSGPTGMHTRMMTFLPRSPRELERTLPGMIPAGGRVVATHAELDRNLHLLEIRTDLPGLAGEPGGREIPGPRSPLHRAVARAARAARAECVWTVRDDAHVVWAAMAQETSAFERQRGIAPGTSERLAEALSGR